MNREREFLKLPLPVKSEKTHGECSEGITWIYRRFVAL
jgi:hypothetical protein